MSFFLPCLFLPTLCFVKLSRSSSSTISNIPAGFFFYSQIGTFVMTCEVVDDDDAFSKGVGDRKMREKKGTGERSSVYGCG